MKEDMTIQAMLHQFLILNILFYQIALPQLWNLTTNVLKESFNKECLHYFYSILLLKNLQKQENYSIKQLLKEKEKYYS